MEGFGEHKIIKEIFEQPEIVRHILNREHDPEILAVKESISETLNNDGDIYLVGSGSSYHSAVFASHLLAKNNFFIAPAVMADDFESYVSDLGRKSLIIFISQSGNNPSILDIYHLLAQRGVKTIAITNDADSPIVNRADLAVLLGIEPEKAIPATKSYLSELLILSLISESLKDGSEFYRSVNNISLEIKRLLASEYHKNIDNIANFLAKSKNLFILGEGVEYASAQESALKIMECGAVTAQAYPNGEFLHGPITLIQPKMPLITFCSNVSDLNEYKDLMTQIKKKGGFIVAVGSESATNIDAFLPIRDFGLFTPIVSIVPIQLLAYKIALIKGLNPDKPEGLNKITEH